MTWSSKTPYAVYDMKGLYAGWDPETGENLPRIGKRAMVVCDANQILDKEQMKALWANGGTMTEATVPGHPSGFWRYCQGCTAEPWYGPRHMKLSFLKKEAYGKHHGAWWLDAASDTVYFMMAPEVFDAIEAGLVNGAEMEADFKPVLRGGYMGIAVA